MGEQNMQNLARALIQQASQDPKAMELLRQIMELAAAIQQEMQAMQQSSQLPNQQPQQKVKAALGTKLDYLNRLKGVCPEGSEKVYLKDGGCMCKPKAQKGAELKEKPKKMNEVLKFKAQKGSVIEKNDTIHHNKQVYDLTGKHPQYKKLTNSDYRKLPVEKQTDVDNKDMMRAKDKKEAEKNACGSKMKKKK